MIVDEAFRERCASPLDHAVSTALSGIYDPCSVAAGRPKNLFEMGLVLGWEASPEGALTVRFCVTFAGCTMAPHFVEAARRELLAINGVTGVTIDVDTTFFWTPERMAIDGDREFPDYQPQAWRKRSDG
ncbi:MAG: iron-sulfur cluster assembly protein [Pseudomonadota bacterium]